MTEKRRAEFSAELTPIFDDVYRAAHYLTGNREDAEELVQEAALLAFRGFHRFTPGTNFKAWFLTILRNRFVSEYRRRKRRIETVSFDPTDGPSLYHRTREAGLHDQTDDPARLLLDSLDNDRIQEALDQLPDEFREACALFFTQDLSYQDIATILEIPVGTVRSRIHRGRRLLQQALWNVARDYGVIPAAGEKP